eukprot:sb/3464448/
MKITAVLAIVTIMSCWDLSTRVMMPAAGRLTLELTDSISKPKENSISNPVLYPQPQPRTQITALTLLDEKRGTANTRGCPRKVFPLLFYQCFQGGEIYPNRPAFLELFLIFAAAGIMNLVDRSQQLMMVTIASTAVIFLVTCITPRSMESGTSSIIGLNVSHLDHGVKEDVFFVFVIPTMAKHREIRDAIRATWMNTTAWGAVQNSNNTNASNNTSNNSTSNNSTNNTRISDDNITSRQYTPEEEEHFKKFKVMFIVAETEQGEDEETKEQVRNEAEEHGDIFMITGLDEHRTVLKYKVIWGFRQSLALFNYSYVIKTDDDIMVNLPYLINLLKGQPRKSLYTGNCAMGYGGFHGFPHWKYCSGGGYIISRDVVERMMQLPRKVHRVPFRPEDGYSGWLIYNLKNTTGGEVKPIKNTHVFCGKNVLLTSPPYDGCFYHHTTPKNFQESFIALKSEPVAEYHDKS